MVSSNSKCSDKVKWHHLPRTILLQKQSEGVMNLNSNSCEKGFLQVESQSWKGQIFYNYVSQPGGLNPPGQLSVFALGTLPP